MFRFFFWRRTIAIFMAVVFAVGVLQIADVPPAQAQGTCSEPADFPEPGEHPTKGGDICVEGTTRTWEWSVWGYENPEKPCPSGFSLVTPFRCHQIVTSSMDAYTHRGINGAWGDVGPPWAYLRHKGTEAPVTCAGGGVDNIMVQGSRLLAFFKDPVEFRCEVGAKFVTSCSGTIYQVNGRYVCLHAREYVSGGGGSGGGTVPVQTMSNYDPAPPEYIAPERTGQCGRIKTEIDFCDHGVVAWKTCPKNWRADVTYRNGNKPAQSRSVEANSYKDGNGVEKYRSRLTVPNHVIDAREGNDGKVELWHQPEDGAAWRLSDSRNFSCPPTDTKRFDLLYNEASGLYSYNKCIGDEVKFSGPGVGKYQITAGTAKPIFRSGKNTTFEPGPDPKDLMVMDAGDGSTDTVILTGPNKPPAGQIYYYHLNLWWQDPAGGEFQKVDEQLAHCETPAPDGSAPIRVNGPEGLVVPSGFSCDNVAVPSRQECLSLVNLYLQTNGPAWNRQDGWLETNTPCEWSGVMCADGKVTRLSREANQLTGSLPELRLPHLRVLNLKRNRLSGPLPDLSGLSSLELINLESNEFTGSVPDFATSPNLVEMNLTRNKFNGNLPNFAGLNNLEKVLLWHNELTGSIPDFQSLPKLTVLSLTRNQLSGSIPNFSGLPNVEVLELSDNQLSGSIPNFDSTPRLRSVMMSDNWLSGSIPDLAHLSSLQGVGVERNLLTGVIPSSVANPSYYYAYIKVNGNCGLTVADADRDRLIEKDHLWSSTGRKCGQTPPPTPTPTPVPEPTATPTPLPTATPTPDSGGVLLPGVNPEPANGTPVAGTPTATPVAGTPVAGTPVAGTPTPTPTATVTPTPTPTVAPRPTPSGPTPTPTPVYAPPVDYPGPYDADLFVAVPADLVFPFGYGTLGPAGRLPTGVPLVDGLNTTKTPSGETAPSASQPLVTDKMTVPEPDAVESVGAQSGDIVAAAPTDGRVAPGTAVSPGLGQQLCTGDIFKFHGGDGIWKVTVGTSQDDSAYMNVNVGVVTAGDIGSVDITNVDAGSKPIVKVWRDSDGLNDYRLLSTSPYKCGD